MINNISVDLACAQCRARNSLKLHRVKPSKSLYVISLIAFLTTFFAFVRFGMADTTLLLLGVIGVFSYWSSRKLIRLTQCR